MGSSAGGQFGHSTDLQCGPTIARAKCDGDCQTGIGSHLSPDNVAVLANLDEFNNWSTVLESLAAINPRAVAGFIDRNWDRIRECEQDWSIAHALGKIAFRSDTFMEGARLLLQLAARGVKDRVRRIYSWNCIRPSSATPKPMARPDCWRWMRLFQQTTKPNSQ